MPHVPPPIYALAAGVAQHLLAPGGKAGLPRKIAAVAVAVASGVLAGGAQREFVHRGTTIDPIRPSRASALVTDGPNGLTRNPMYVGLAGLLAAHALARGGWATPLPVIAFVAVVDRLQIPAEEVALRELFGAEYAAYCDSVPRWLGPTS